MPSPAYEAAERRVYEARNALALALVDPMPFLANQMDAACVFADAVDDFIHIAETED